MFKSKRLKIRILPSISEKSPIINAEATHNKELPAATDVTEEVFKTMPAPNLIEMVEQRMRENSQLRRKLAYQRRKQGASIYFLEEVRIAVNSLQEAVIRFQELRKKVENEFV